MSHDFISVFNDRMLHHAEGKLTSQMQSTDTIWNMDCSFADQYKCSAYSCIKCKKCINHSHGERERELKDQTAHISSNIQILHGCLLNQPPKIHYLKILLSSTIISHLFKKRKLEHFESRQCHCQSFIWKWQIL